LTANLKPLTRGGGNLNASALRGHKKSNMAYCTTNDLVTALGATVMRELVNVITSSTAASSFPTTTESNRVAQAIEDADAKIDLYCSRYEVPFTDTAADYVKPISIDFTEWNLRNDRVVMTTECENKYDEWRAVLDLVVEQKISVPGATVAT
jgi:phage gp36-like protein